MVDFILNTSVGAAVPFAEGNAIAGRPEGGSVLVQAMPRTFGTDVILRFLNQNGSLEQAAIPLSSGLALAFDLQALVLDDGRIAVAWRGYENPSEAARNVLVMLDASGQELGRTEWVPDGTRILMDLSPSATGGVSLLSRDFPSADAFDVFQQDFGTNGESLGDARVVAQARADRVQAGDTAQLADGGRAVLVHVRDGNEAAARLFMLEADGATRAAPLTIGNGMVPFSAQILALPDGGLLALWTREGEPTGVLQAQRISADGTVQPQLDEIQLAAPGAFHFLVDLVALPGDRYGIAYSVFSYAGRFDVVIQDISQTLAPMNNPQIVAQRVENPFSVIFDQSGPSELTALWQDQNSNGTRLFFDAYSTDLAATQGTDGDDRLGTLDAPGLVFLGDGDDEIRGSSGSDMIAGNAGNDTIRSSWGNDTMAGNAGNDYIAGGGGYDSLFGDDGHDVLIGAMGHDRLYGGNDGDTLFGGHDRDWLYGGAGNDILHGEADSDFLDGGLGSDTLIGHDGRDSLGGNAGADLLFGNAGNDYLNGGYGNDQLHGGSGADKFIHGGQPRHGTDWVADFDASEGDHLVIWPQPTVPSRGGSSLQLNFAHVAGAGSDEYDEAFVIYRPTGQILWVLVDGEGRNLGSLGDLTADTIL